MLIGNRGNEYVDNIYDNDKESLSLSSSTNKSINQYIRVYGVDKLLDKIKLSDIERYLRRKKLKNLDGR